MADAMESLRKTLELCLDRLAPEATETTNRLLFPNGIEAIHINATLGLGNKGFSLDIDIPGPKADAPHGEPKAADGLGEFHLPQFAQALDDSHALATSQDVVNACKSVFPQHQFACNDFVTAVTFFGFVGFQGTADEMVGAIQAQPWNYLGHDLNAASQAAASAGMDGRLVVAGLTSDELSDTNGHVVIVVPGALVNNKYPHLYCGSTKSSIRLQSSSINYAFASGVRDRVHYGWIALT